MDLRNLRYKLHAFPGGQEDFERILLKNIPLKKRLSPDDLEELGDKSVLDERWPWLSQAERNALVLDAYLRRQERDELADRLSPRPYWPFAIGPSLAALALLIVAAAFVRYFGGSATPLPQQIIVTWGNSAPQPLPPTPVSPLSSALLWLLTGGLVAAGVKLFDKGRHPVLATSVLGIAAFTGLTAHNPRFLEDIIGKINLGSLISIHGGISINAGAGRTLEFTQVCEVGPFVPGWYALQHTNSTGEPMESARKCAEKLQNPNPKASALLIVGQTDRTDLSPAARITYGSNAALAYNRANAVKQFLGNIPESVLLSVGPLALETKDLDALAKDRVVRVFAYVNPPVGNGSGDSPYRFGFTAGVVAGLLGGVVAGAIGLTARINLRRKGSVKKQAPGRPSTSS